MVPLCIKQLSTQHVRCCGMWACASTCYVCACTACAAAPLLAQRSKLVTAAILSSYRRKLQPNLLQPYCVRHVVSVVCSMLVLLTPCCCSPLDHMSTPKVYRVDPSKISGALYQRVAT